MREYSELEKIRLAKMDRLRAAGMEPYPSRAQRTHTTAQAFADYAQQVARQAATDEHTPQGDYTVVGRLRGIRIMGKAAFAHIEDGTGRLQLYFRSNELGADK